MSSVEEDSAGDDLMDALVQVTFHVTGVLSRIGAENDLSLTQLRVFGILRDRRPRVTELAAHLGLDKSTISGLIDRAEQRGFLARARSVDDRRAVEVFLTPDGQDLTRRIYADVRRELDPMLGGLSAEQHTQLNGLIHLVTLD